MSQVVEMLKDVYPYGCLGDIVTLEKDAVAELDNLAKKLKSSPLYKEVAAEARKVSKEVADKVDPKNTQASK